MPSSFYPYINLSDLIITLTFAALIIKNKNKRRETQVVWKLQLINCLYGQKYYQEHEDQNVPVHRTVAHSKLIQIKSFQKISQKVKKKTKNNKGKLYFKYLKLGVI